MSNNRPKTIDDYLKSLDSDKRVALEKLRKAIKSVAPKAEECISYGLAAFRVNGRALVAFGATKNHCAFFPMNSTLVAAFKNELKQFDTSKGTIRFQPDKPLPVALVRKLVNSRIAENHQKAANPKTVNKPQTSLANQAAAVIAELKRLATKKTLDGMARYGLPSDKAFGVSVGDIQRLAKRLGRNHELADALWKTGWYEARMLTAYVDEPEKVTPAQMDRWSSEFDNWGICDTICFCLFDRTPHAWKKARQWAKSPREFVKRTGYVLMACLAGHDKTATDKQFLDLLPLIERGAQDERNFVKKGVSWGLRMIGRRNLSLNKAALAVAKRLSLSQNAASRWVGKDAFRELSSPKVQARLNRPTK